jgi:hypothetical protein
VVELPEDMAISNTFNVADLFTYHPDEPIYANSRTIFLEEGEIDVGQSKETPRNVDKVRLGQYLRRGVRSTLIRDVPTFVSVQCHDLTLSNYRDAARSSPANYRDPAR